MVIQGKTLERIKEYSKNSDTIVFGAGDMGRFIVDRLINNGITVKYIWDNDTLKQGSFHNNVEIIGYDKLKKERDFLLIIGCNYVKQEEQRIEALDYMKVCFLYEKEEVREFVDKDKECLPDFKRDMEEQVNIYDDELSKDTALLLADDILGYKMDYGYGLSVKEEHYLVKEVLEFIDGNKLIYVDCGAFHGEFPRFLESHGIEFEKCYCFEMEPGIFEELKAICNKTKISQGTIIPVLGGVADEEKEVYYEIDGAATKIVDYKTKFSTRVLTLDNFFKEQSVDFIKMDIEGAELSALKGAINVIKRDRPVLAISVYHSLKDRIEIPKFLYENLSGYKFYLRHHSFGLAETVFYGVPN